MTQANVELYQRVALTRDLLEHLLPKGDSAVGVEYLPGISMDGCENGYTLEVTDRKNKSILPRTSRACPLESLARIFHKKGQTTLSVFNRVGNVNEILRLEP